MDKIVEALSKLLPESEVNEVAGAVKDMIGQAKAALEKEFSEKLEEAYAELSEELAQAEKTAEAGYQEAYSIINELRNRLELQGEEYKAALDEGYEEAYQMLKAEKEKVNSNEVEMYEEYDRKLAEMKEYIVDKVDQFLQFKGAEIYENAKREVLNDPRTAEHRVALDKIVNIVADVTNEDFGAVSNSKLTETQKKIEELQGQLRIMEARNIRISTENTKLNEAVRQAQEIVNESRRTVAASRKDAVVTEQKERVTKAKNATGRGIIEESTSGVITEHAEQSADMDQLLVLSGLKKS